MQQLGFRLFKWTVYSLLALNVYFYLRTEETLTAFIDSAAWVALLGVMEYESSTLTEGYSGRIEKWAVAAVTLLAYAFIVYAFYGYIAERRWIDVVNAGSWLLVVLVLLWQMYVPGGYDRWELRAIRVAKGVLYATLLGCALWWTIDAEKPLDAIDAWLWIVCFVVIELNVVGAEAAGPARGATPAPDDRTAT